jgi:hypothetical protein
MLDGEKILIAYPASWSDWIIRRLHPDGSLDRQWPVRLAGDPPWINAMTLQGGRLLVAVSSGTVNGIPIGSGVARLLLEDAPESAAVIAPKPEEYVGWQNWNPQGFEGMGEAEITVRRLGDVRATATINYRTQDSSANAGRDYGALAGTLTFAPLEMEKSFQLPILNDTEFESEETLALVLSPGSGVSTVGPKTLFTIHDDEVTISGMQIHRDVNGVPSYVSFTFNSVPDQVYVVERSTDLKSWQSVGSVKASDGSYRSTWGGAGLFGSPNWFFRVRRQ